MNKQEYVVLIFPGCITNIFQILVQMLNQKRRCGIIWYRRDDEAVYFLSNFFFPTKMSSKHIISQHITFEGQEMHSYSSHELTFDECQNKILKT